MIDIRKRFSEYISAIRKFPLDFLLDCLYEISFNKNTLANRIYQDNIQKYISKEHLPFFIAQISQDVIICSNIYRSFNMNKLADYLYMLFKTAKEYYIDCIRVDIGSDEQIDNILSMLFRTADTQFIYQEPPIKFGRTIILFLELAKKNNIFDFEKYFYSQFNILIDDFIQCSFLIYSLARRGRFSNNAIKFDGSLILPKNDAFFLTLDILSANQNTFREIYKKSEPEDERFYIHRLNPLRIKPIFRFDNRYSYNISPLPSLILSQCHTVIYYNMHKFFSVKNSNKFTEWFGDLLQNYTEYIFRSQIATKNSIILTEKDIEKSGYKRKKPDLIYIDEKNHCAILIECKAARRYRGAIQSASKKELFEVTGYHINQAYKQIEEFSKNIKDGNVNIDALKTLKYIYGAVITWEDLFIFNTRAVKTNKLPNIQYSDGIHVLCLDILEDLACCDNLSDIFAKLSANDDSDSVLRLLINHQNKNYKSRYQQEHWLFKKIMDYTNKLKAK